MKTLLSTILVILTSVFIQSAYSQVRYDEHKLEERFSVRLGGFAQTEIDSTVRLDSDILGLGTLIDLEEKLNVDDEVKVFRLDGFYRFNDRHRIEFSWYSIKREGSNTVVGEDIQIGDETFEIGTNIETEFNFDVYKVGWAWSYINVKPYEFYIGAGLNIRDTSLKFDGSLNSGSTIESESFDENAIVPLPTINFGGRINFNEKLALHWRIEAFSIEISDYGGKLQDSYLLLEHNTFKNVGFGLGINSFNFDLEAEGDDISGELDSNYLGLLIYAKAFF